MSAIFGLYGRHDRKDVLRMAERLRHRGSKLDIRSVGDDLTVGAIGHDPAGMICVTEDTALVADATVYNRSDLSGSLGTSPRSLPPRSTAELFHRLDFTRAPNRLDDINGDFAMAIIDRQADSIAFSRDFFGCRPLYICMLKHGGVAFASEYKALLALRDLNKTVDIDMVQYLQCAKKLPVGRTLLKEIIEVPPGQLTAWADAAGLRCLHAIPALEVDITVREESKAIELVQALLRESLRRRIEDLDTIGLALSGGIDSIALAFLMRELRPSGVIHTFTAGSDLDDKELKTAARVARTIGSIHHEVLTLPALLKDRLAQFVWHIEDPFSRSEALQLFEIGRVAAEFVDVLFTGQGSDGLFAGMPKFRLLWLAARFPMLTKGLEEFFNLTQIGVKPSTMTGRLLDYLKYRGKLPRVPLICGARLPEPTSFPERGRELINRAACRGLQASVCQDVHKIERGFSAFGVEYRLPFYDLRLVRAAYTITDRLKITAGSQKYIFRKAMENIVPKEFWQVPKFPQRMRYDLAFSEYLDEIGRELLLENGGACDRGLYDTGTLRSLFRMSSQIPYRDEAAMRIWTAAVTELWFRMFVDDSVESSRSAKASVSDVA